MILIWLKHALWNMLNLYTYLADFLMKGDIKKISFLTCHQSNRSDPTHRILTLVDNHLPIIPLGHPYTNCINPHTNDIGRSSICHLWLSYHILACRRKAFKVDTIPSYISYISISFLDLVDQELPNRTQIESNPWFKSLKGEMGSVQLPYLQPY